MQVPLATQSGITRSVPVDPSNPNDAKLRRAAEQMEAGFLTEMLKHAGLNAVGDGFDGGAGEEQFASFLREEQARAIAAKGGVGLAEQIFESLKRAQSDG